MNRASQSEPCGARPSDHADQQDQHSGGWEEHAAQAVGVIETAVAPCLKRATDDVYENLLYSVQEYLRENVLFNLRSETDAARRQALHDRLHSIETTRQAEALFAALKATRRGLFIAVDQATKELVGFDPTTHVAIKQADDAMAEYLRHPLGNLASDQSGDAVTDAELREVNPNAPTQARAEDRR